MHTNLLRTAVAAAVLLLPLRAEAEATAGTRTPQPTPAHLVVDRLLAHHERLLLSDRQAVELTVLSSRLRRDRGHLQVAGLDRVPGKAVPRLVRVFTTPEQALRSALGLLTYPQRLEAARLLETAGAAPALSSRQSQSVQADAAAKDSVYETTTNYDRLTDSTRVTVVLKGSSRPFGLGSRVSLDLSFTYPGVHLTAPPEAVVLTLESFTPARGGWAFAHPQQLRVRSGKTVKLEVPAAHYAQLRVGLFDAGRREELSFRIPTEQFTPLAGEPEVEFKAGNASIRFRDARMEMLREVVRRMTPPRTEQR